MVHFLTLLPYMSDGTFSHNTAHIHVSWYIFSQYCKHTCQMVHFLTTLHRCMLDSTFSQTLHTCMSYGTFSHNNAHMHVRWYIFSHYCTHTCQMVHFLTLLHTYISAGTFSPISAHIHVRWYVFSHYCTHTCQLVHFLI